MKSSASKHIKFYRPKQQLTQVVSSSQLYRSIASTIQRSVSRDLLPSINQSTQLRHSKSVTQTIYRCGCVIENSKGSKGEKNATLELPIGEKKQMEIRLMSHKSLDGLRKLKNVKTLGSVSKESDRSKPKTGLKKSRQFKPKEESELKKLLKQLASLKQEHSLLQKDMEDIELRKREEESKPRREIIKYIPKETVVHVDKVRRVEVPREKVVYRKKKVPREIVEYKEVLVEVPIVREELVFVDPEPLPPVVKEVTVVNEVKKEVVIKNPLNDLNQKELTETTRKCRELEQRIEATKGVIDELRREIAVRNEMRIGAHRSAHFLPNVPLVNPQVSIVLPTKDSFEAKESSQQQIRQSPMVSRFQIEEALSPLTPPPMSNESFKKTTANDSTVLSGRSTITRITSEGRIINMNQPATAVFETTPVLIHSQTEQRLSSSTLVPAIKNTSTVVMTSATAITTQSTSTTQIRSSSRIVRKYCKKNCGDTCTCMSDMFTIVERAQR